MRLREREGVEAVVPAPHLVHPVLRHEHRLAPDESGRIDGRAPEHIGGEGGGAVGFDEPRQRRRVVRELVRACGDHIVEFLHLAHRRTFGGELLDRDLPGCAVGARGDRPVPRPEQFRADHLEASAERRDPVAAARLVRGEDRGAVRGRHEEVVAGEGGEGVRRVAESHPQPATTHPQPTGGLEDHRDLPAIAHPAQRRRRRDQLHDRGRPGRHRREFEHRVHARRVRDEVHVLRATMQADHPRHREPRAAGAERDLVEREGEFRGHRPAPLTSPHRPSHRPTRSAGRPRAAGPPGSTRRRPSP